MTRGKVFDSMNVVLEGVIDREVAKTKYIKIRYIRLYILGHEKIGLLIQNNYILLGQTREI